MTMDKLENILKCQIYTFWMFNVTSSLQRMFRGDKGSGTIAYEILVTVGFSASARLKGEMLTFTFW